MSLTSYRAAPPRVVVAVGGRWEGGDGDGVGWWCGPGGDLLSHVLRRSTMGAAGFHGRVRNGVGWGTRAMATRSSGPSRWPLRRAGRAGGWRGVLAAGRGGRECWQALGMRSGVRCGCRWRGSRSIERLGPVSCTRRRASTSGLSTWWSATALMARPGFEVGFPLRCFQRLSRPNLATRLRGWRHDRSTRGSSTPVLSY